MTEPQQCTTLAEVRAAIDTIDEQIIGLLGRRFRFVEAAARVKHSRREVRDAARITEVIEHVRKRARAAGVPEELVARFYEQMIEAAIAIELKHFEHQK